jgi:hypothetical protein
VPAGTRHCLVRSPGWCVPPRSRMDRRDDVPSMTFPTTASEQTYIEVTGGVDTHKDTHTAAALDASGRLLGHQEFAASAAGYAALLA